MAHVDYSDEAGVAALVRDIRPVFGVTCRDEEGIGFGDLLALCCRQRRRAHHRDLLRATSLRGSGKDHPFLNVTPAVAVDLLRPDIYRTVFDDPPPVDAHSACAKKIDRQERRMRFFGEIIEQWIAGGRERTYPDDARIDDADEAWLSGNQRCPGASVGVNRPKHDHAPVLEKIRDSLGNGVGNAFTNFIRNRSHTCAFLNFEFSSVTAHRWSPRLVGRNVGGG
jgi:hypothetical protein